jgi:hypothetical protein
VPALAGVCRSLVRPKGKKRAISGQSISDFATRSLTTRFRRAPGVSGRCAARSDRGCWPRCRWRIPDCAANTPRVAVIPVESLCPPGFTQPLSTRWTQSVDTSRVPDVPGGSVVQTSRGDRRLKQPTTVRLPSIGTDIRASAARVRARFRRVPVQPRMRAMTVQEVDNATPIVLSLEKFVIRGIHGAVGLSRCTRR